MKSKVQSARLDNFQFETNLKYDTLKRSVLNQGLSLYYQD